MTLRNTFAATCCHCQRPVAPGDGILARNVGVVRGWNVKHDACAFETEIEMIDEEDPLS